MLHKHLHLIDSLNFVKDHWKSIACCNQKTYHSIETVNHSTYHSLVFEFKIAYEGLSG